MSMSFIAKESLKSMTVLGATCIPMYMVYKHQLKIDKGLESSFNIAEVMDVFDDDDYQEHSLTLYSHESHWDDTLKYIYHMNKGKIKDISYEKAKIFAFNDWRQRRKPDAGTIQFIKPVDTNLFTDHEFEESNYQIEIQLSTLKDDTASSTKPMKILESGECSSCSENILQKLVLKSSNERVLIDYVDAATNYVKDEYKRIQSAHKDSFNIYYYKSEFWMLLSKTPKRSSDTIYLKKGQKEDIMKKVQDFFSPSTRAVYIKYGIPYKSVCMIHGPPGTGKTSTIKSIASSLDCDLYVIPIVKDMLDSHLVDAFSSINDKEDKERIIVIEDIDTMFDDRKEGDKHNGITLQGFLNCLDGFTCMEGTMLFITANKPEVLDFAMIRSCRIDIRYELGYADKYQIHQMFTQFFPTQEDSFEDFYNDLSHKDITTAMLQEFFFYNRDCDDILSKIDQLLTIISKNDPKHYDVVKDTQQHCYM